MRTGWILSLVLLGMILTGGLAEEYAVKQAAQQYISAAEELQILTADGAWQRAEETLAAYQADWLRRTAWLRLILQHDGLMDIAMDMERLTVGVRRQDASLCAISCVELRQHAAALRDREIFSWGNLL